MDFQVPAVELKIVDGKAAHYAKFSRLKKTETL